MRRILVLAYLITQITIGTAISAIIEVPDANETPFLLSVDIGCSATVLSPHVIVTAAHCVSDRTSQQLSSKEMSFSLNPDVNYGQSEIKASLATYKFKTWGISALGVSPFVKEDWAIFISDTPILLESYPPLFPYESIHLLQESQLSIYGYPVATNSNRAKTINTSVRKIKSGFLEVNQNHKGLGGFSGGPAIVTDGPYKGHYAGVNSAIGIARNRYRISYSQELYKKLSELILNDGPKVDSMELRKHFNSRFCSANF